MCCANATNESERRRRLRKHWAAVGTIMSKLFFVTCRNNHFMCEHACARARARTHTHTHREREKIFFLILITLNTLL